MKNKLDVESIINAIRSVEDARLKSITDIVAFKISKSSNGRGAGKTTSLMPRKIMAAYISENYSTLDKFHEGLTKLGRWNQRDTGNC